MKILLLNFEKTWRGGERQTIYSLKGLTDDKFHEPALLCRKGFPLEKQALQLGFKVHSFNSIIAALYFLITEGKIYKILHAQTSHILTWCVVAKIFTNHKIVYTRRVDFIQKGFATKLKYKLTDKIVAISNAIRKILNDFGVKNVEVIPSAVQAKAPNTDRAKKLIQTLGISNKNFIVATTAAMVQHKDPLTMAEAIKTLSEKRNDFAFIHFGNGPLLHSLQEKIKTLNIGDIYLLPGFRDDVEDFFSIMDVFVMSSEEEGLGSSVLDAFIYEVPVVATKAGGMKELLMEGTNGIICNIHSSEELADGINTVLNNRELATNLSKHAKEYVLEKHSIEKVNRQYTVLYTSMTDTKNPNH